MRSRIGTWLEVMTHGGEITGDLQEQIRAGIINDQELRTGQEIGGVHYLLDRFGTFTEEEI